MRAKRTIRFDSRQFDKLRGEKKPYRVYDRGTDGLYAVVLPSGCVTFYFRYASLIDSKEVNIKLGRYPGFAVVDA